MDAATAPIHNAKQTTCRNTSKEYIATKNVVAEMNNTKFEYAFTCEKMGLDRKSRKVGKSLIGNTKC
jgi:hypothetical protein